MRNREPRLIGTKEITVDGKVYTVKVYDEPERHPKLGWMPDPRNLRDGKVVCRAGKSQDELFAEETKRTSPERLT